MPFGRAVKTLKNILRVDVSKSTAVRSTEEAGAAYVEIQEETVTEVERKAPPAPEGAERLLFSGDGAMVPVLHGEWKEVRTLAIGEVKAAAKGEIRMQAMSYFSRLASAEEFTRMALVETHRRGVENSQHVGAVMDGAEWLQVLIDYHAPQAVRILDFAHAAQRIAEFAPDPPKTEASGEQKWLPKWCHSLKHEGPQALLQELRRLQAQQPDNESLANHLAYLEKRQEQMRYPEFIQQGWPIGSGAVESANKLVVEARLKGAGMHWQLTHVNPMLALRNIVCSDRWDEAWPQIEKQLRCEANQQRHQRCQRRFSHRREMANTAKLAALSSPPPRSLPSPNRTQSDAPAPFQEAAVSSAQPNRPNRPAPDHPWRRSPIGRARYRTMPDAKS